MSNVPQFIRLKCIEPRSHHPVPILLHPTDTLDIIVKVNGQEIAGHSSQTIEECTLYIEAWEEDVDNPS